MSNHSERFTFAPLCLKAHLVIRHIRCVGLDVAGALYLNAINSGFPGSTNGAKSTSPEPTNGEPSASVGRFVISVHFDPFTSAMVWPPLKSVETYMVRSSV